MAKEYDPVEEYMKNKGAEKKSSSWFIWLLIALLIVGVWGYVGAQQAEAGGVTCKMGVMDDRLCWKWEKNVAGTIEEGVDDYFGPDNSGNG